MNTLQELIEGDKVKFYDSDLATKEKCYSGEDERYYPIGTIIKIYYVSHSEEKLVDIQLPDGRISKGHFAYGIIKQQEVKP